MLGQPGQEDAGVAATAEYRAAMRRVGSAQSRQPPTPECPRSPGRPALIPSEEYVGDDWLEDDVGPSRGSRKRSRLSREEDSASESEEASGPESDIGAPCQPPEAARKKRRIRQSRLTQLVDRVPLGRTRGVGLTATPGQPANDPSPLRGEAGSSPVNSSTGGCESPPPGSAQVSLPEGRGCSSTSS